MYSDGTMREKSWIISSKPVTHAALHTPNGSLGNWSVATEFPCHAQYRWYEKSILVIYISLWNNIAGRKFCFFSYKLLIYNVDELIMYAPEACHSIVQFSHPQGLYIRLKEKQNSVHGFLWSP